MTYFLHEYILGMILFEDDNNRRIRESLVSYFTENRLVHGADAPLTCTHNN